MWKPHRLLGVIVLFITTCTSSFAQGFINLDFEMAIVEPTVPTYGWLDWNLAVPGWNHSSGGDTSVVFYGSPHLGTSQCYLLMDATSPFYAPNTQLSGAYSLSFSSGVLDGGAISSPWVNAYISQTGTIPVGTHSIQMLATGPFEVFVNTTKIPMQALGGNLFGGDIAGFSGTTAQLKIVNTGTMAHQDTIVDDILFSPVSIPEPTIAALAMFSAMLMSVRRRQRNSLPPLLLRRS